MRKDAQISLVGDLRWTWTN